MSEGASREFSDEISYEMCTKNSLYFIENVLMNLNNAWMKETLKTFLKKICAIDFLEETLGEFLKESM